MIDKELRDYYENRFSMMGEQGWKDLMDDVQKMIDATNDLSFVQDEKSLHFKRGELSIMRWLLNLKTVSETAFEQLENKNATL